MLTYLLLFGMAIFALAFVMWLTTFLLNRGLDTSLETKRESRHRTLGQLGYGGLLLGLTVLLAVIFTQIDREPVLPEVPKNADFRTVLTVRGPPASTGMDVTLVAGGIALSGAAFVFWLGTFMLSQSIGSTLQSPRASRHRKNAQLCIGAFLLCLTSALVVVFFKMDRSALVPELETEVAKPATSAPPAELDAPDEATAPVPVNTPESIPPVSTPEDSESEEEPVDAVAVGDPLAV